MNDNYLAHHGVKGMKWGVRRYQNPDGTRTTLGKIHEKTSSPEFKKAARTGAKIAAGVLAAYATHKIINNPKVVAKGASVAKSILSSTGKIKTSAMNTTEFKLAKKTYETAKKAAPAVSKVKNAAKSVGLKDAVTVGVTGASIYGMDKYLERKYGPETSKKIITYGRQPKKKK